MARTKETPVLRCVGMQSNGKEVVKYYHLKDIADITQMFSEVSNDKFNLRLLKLNPLQLKAVGLKPINEPATTAKETDK